MRLGAGLLAAIFGASCGSAPKDPVDRLIHDISRAVEARDVEGAAARLADGFQGQDGISRSEAIASLRRTLAGYERVGVDVFDVQREGQSVVGFRVHLTGKPKDIRGLAGLLPSSAVYRFDLELIGQGQDLKVQRAAWREWQPPPTP